jgi:HEPN domain-containing protein
MKNETRIWISYANENLDVARLALEHGHLNSSLQNVQQAVEKYLKAVIVEKDFEFQRTHSIRELVGILTDQGIRVNISDDEMDLMDAVYLPSKYPIYSALPHSLPEPEICRDALNFAEKVQASVSGILNLEECR